MLDSRLGRGTIQSPNEEAHALGLPGVGGISLSDPEVPPLQPTPMNWFQRPPANCCASTLSACPWSSAATTAKGWAISAVPGASPPACADPGATTTPDRDGAPG